MKETNCKSHWNILVFCDQWKILSDLNMSHGKNFVSFPLFGFTLVVKLRNFDFESSWNTLILFDKKIYDVIFEYALWKNNLIWLCPVKQYLVWFNLLKLGVAFLYPLKTFRFPDVFRPYRKATPGCNGLSSVAWVEFWQ